MDNLRISIIIRYNQFAMLKERFTMQPHLMIDGYSEMQNDKHPQKLETNSRFVALATSIRLKNKSAQSVAFVTGCTTPSIARQMARQVMINVRKTNIPFTIRPDGNVTSQEIATHSKIIKEKRMNTISFLWKKYEYITIEDHMKRVKRGIRREFGLMTRIRTRVISAEDIILEEAISLGNNRLKKVIETHRASPEQQAWRDRETIYNIIDSIPFLGKRVFQFADSLQQKKIITNKNTVKGKGLADGLYQFFLKRRLKFFSP